MQHNAHCHARSVIRSTAQRATRRSFTHRLLCATGCGLNSAKPLRVAGESDGDRRRHTATGTGKTGRRDTTHTAASARLPSQSTSRRCSLTACPCPLLCAQLLRLPPRVRAMSVREFALLHSLSVSSVALESAHSQQQQLAEWVQATPRLNKHSAAAGGGRRELQALLAQPSSLQPYMHLLNTAQRMTRATARKAGLAAQQQQAGAGEATVLSELRHVNGSGPEQTHVFQTPSGRVR